MITTERTTGSERRGARAPWLGWVVPVALAAAPWSWFAIRDLGSIMDAVAVGLPVGAIVTAAVAFGVAMLSERMRFALVSLSLVVFTIVVVVAPRLPQRSAAPTKPFLLLSANTFDDNPVPGSAVRTLLAQHADVVVAVETMPPIAMAIAHAYPDDHRQDRLGVYSTWPVHAMPPIDGVPAASAMRVEVLRPGAPFVLYAIHLPNPLHEVSFSAHAAMVDGLLAAATREDLPVVLAGDFNMSDRSTSYRALDAALRDAMRSSFADSTYDHDLWVLLQLRIDHVFVSQELCAGAARTLSLPGSDHDGVAVSIGACPS